MISLSAQGFEENPKWIIIDSSGNLIRDKIRLEPFQYSAILPISNKPFIFNYFVTTVNNSYAIHKINDNEIIPIQYIPKDSSVATDKCAILRAIITTNLSLLDCKSINQIQDFDIQDNQNILLGTKNYIILSNQEKFDTLVKVSKISLSYTTGIYSPIFYTSNNIVYINNKFDKKTRQVNSQVYLMNLKTKKTKILCKLKNAFLLYRVNNSSLVILCKDKLVDNNLYRVFYYNSKQVYKTSFKIIGGYFF